MTAPVPRIEAMPALAVGLLCLGGYERGTSKQILPLSDRLEVRGVDATAIAAKVVDVQAGRDSADERLVGEPMRGHLALPNCQLSVAVRSSVSDPQPAPGVRFRG
jgi:hypothetical protein